MPLKPEIRKRLLEKLKNQPEEKRLKKSLAIEKKLFSLKEFERAKTIMFYVSTNGEVDTLKMIDAASALGKRIAVPVTLVREKKIFPSLLANRDRELTQGPYGIPQPKTSCRKEVPLEEIDLVVVPGVAFDEKGHRLGRGGGYYDRFLENCTSRGIPLVGLAFKFQVIKNLPFLSHDVPVTTLITA